MVLVRETVDRSHGFRCTVIARNVLLALVLGDVMLVALHITLGSSGWRIASNFDLDMEATVGTWYSSTKLFSIGVLISVLAFRNRRLSYDIAAVGALGLLFIAMSLDETAGLHERAGGLIDMLLGSRADTAYGRTGLWFVVLGIPAVLMFGFLVLRVATMLDEGGRISTLFVAGLAIFFTGSLGVEMFSNFTGTGSAYALSVAAEEGLELIGISVVLSSVIWCLEVHPSTRLFLLEIRRPYRG